MKMTSEKKQRLAAKDLSCFEVQTENAMFTFPQKSKGEEIRSAATVHVHNISHIVTSLLDLNERYITRTIIPLCINYIKLFIMGLVNSPGTKVVFQRTRCG